MKVRVYGIVSIGVSIVIDTNTDDRDVVYDEASDQFGGMHNFAGNGGCDKLVGVYGSDESIEAGDEVEWNDIEIL